MNDVPKSSFYKDAFELREDDICVLRQSVRAHYTEKRYVHALSVEEEAAHLGKIYLPAKINALRAAALLHDITKKYDFEKQLQYCSEFGIILSNPCSPEILHAVTGPLAAKKEFPQYTDKEILDAIRWHSTGRWGMTVFEAIIFLADYIEPTRTHEKCIFLRNELYAGIAESKTDLEREKALNSAVLSALDNTITYLVSKKCVIDPDTFFARNYYLSEKEL